MPEREEPKRDEKKRQKKHMAGGKREHDQRNRHTYRKRPQHLPPSDRSRSYIHRYPLTKTSVPHRAGRIDVLNRDRESDRSRLLAAWLPPSYGVGKTVKCVEVAFPPFVATSTLPEPAGITLAEAPVGMTAVNLVPLALDRTRTDRMPLNHTVAPARLWPEIVIVAPSIPEVGATRVIVGAADG
jgi:hypothetical protein